MVDLCGYGFRKEKLSAVSLVGVMFCDNNGLLASYLQVEWLCSRQAEWLATHICTSCTHICFLSPIFLSPQKMPTWATRLCWHCTSAEKPSISHIHRVLLALQQSWDNDTWDHVKDATLNWTLRSGTEIEDTFLLFSLYSSSPHKTALFILG